MPPGGHALQCSACGGCTVFRVSSESGGVTVRVMERGGVRTCLFYVLHVFHMNISCPSRVLHGTGVLDMLSLRQAVYVSVRAHVSSLRCPSPVCAQTPSPLPPAPALDVVEWMKAAGVGRSSAHTQPGVQGALGGRVQRVVLRERQHHCISLRVCS